MKTKPNVLKLSVAAVALVAAFAMTGCGKKNNNAGPAPLPNPQYPQGNYPPGTNPGQLSGLVAQGSMMVRADSASVVSNGGGWGCSIPYEVLNLAGQSQDGVITIQGQSQQCSAQVVVQVQLSQLVHQDILRQMMMSGGYYGGYAPQISSVAVAQVNLSRAGNRLYDGGIQPNRASVVILVNGQFPYLMYF